MFSFMVMFILIYWNFIIILDVWILKIPAVDSKDFRIGKFYCYFLVTYAMGNREVHTYGDTIEVMYKYNREER